MVRTLNILECTSILALVCTGCATPPGVIFPADQQVRAWPAPPATARIRYLGQIANGADLKPGKTSRQAWIEALRGPTPTYSIGSPHDVEVYHDRCYVTSPATATLHVLDLNARTHTRIRQAGDTPFQSPIGVAAGMEGVYVTDSVLGSVIKFDTNGRFISRFGNEDLKRPTGIAVSRHDGTVFVLDTQTDECVIFDENGTVRSRFGSSGTGPGQFNRPTHLAFQPPDRLWIVDTMSSRMQQFDRNGRWISMFGERGDASGDFSLPKGIAIDVDGHLHVVDSHFEMVQIFDAEGQLLLAYGGPGNGAENLSVPAGMTIDEHHRVWIADTYHHRLAVYEYVPNVRVPETATVIDEEEATGQPC